MYDDHALDFSAGAMVYLLLPRINASWRKFHQQSPQCTCYPNLTFTIPFEIIPSSRLLSHNGYKMTVNADAKAQIMPMTTHASSPRLPNTVEVKNSGSGMMRSIITSYQNKFISS
jgi:hypothetical protein